MDGWIAYLRTMRAEDDEFELLAEVLEELDEVGSELDAVGLRVGVYLEVVGEGVVLVDVDEGAFEGEDDGLGEGGARGDDGVLDGGLLGDGLELVLGIGWEDAGADVLEEAGLDGGVFVGVF